MSIFKRKYHGSSITELAASPVPLTSQVNQIQALKPTLEQKVDKILEILLGREAMKGIENEEGDF